MEPPPPQPPVAATPNKMFTLDAALILGVATALGNSCVAAFEVGWGERFAIPYPLVSVNLGSLLLALVVGLWFIFIVVYNRWLASVSERLYLWTWRLLRAPMRAGLVERLEPSQEIDVDALTNAAFGRNLLFRGLMFALIFILVSRLTGTWTSSVYEDWSFVNERCVVVAWFGDNVIAEEYDTATHRAIPLITVYRADKLPPMWNASHGKILTTTSEPKQLQRFRKECPAVESGNQEASPRGRGSR